IGQQQPVLPLPSHEAKTRIHLAFRSFIGVFARSGRPLAIFLDDLQWLDAATLDFLEDLVVQHDRAPLLVVAAYRDDELDWSDSLARTVSAIRNAGRAVQEIGLQPLGPADLARLIEDAFHCEHPI